MFKKKDSVTLFWQQQPFRLTMAKHTLGIHPMRILMQVLSKIQHLMSMEVDCSQPMEDLWIDLQLNKIAKGKNLHPLRDALEALMKRIVRVTYNPSQENKKIEVGTPILKEYRYSFGSANVQVQISGNFLPFMIDLARGYTSYNLNVALSASSSRILRIYQYISHFKDKSATKEPIICHLKTLREWLGLEGSYALPCDIKKRILVPAIKELKKKADVWFDIAGRIMSGRKMIGWKFNIYTREENNLENEKGGMAQEEKKALPSELEKLITRLTETHKLGVRQAKKVAQAVAQKKIEAKDLKQFLYSIYIQKQTQSPSPINDVGAFTVAKLNARYDLKL